MLKLVTFVKQLELAGAFWDNELSFPSADNLADDFINSCIVETRSRLLKDKAIELPVLGLLKLDLAEKKVKFETSITLKKSLKQNKLIKYQGGTLFLVRFFNNRLKKDKLLKLLRSDEENVQQEVGQLLYKYCSWMRDEICNHRPVEIETIGMFERKADEVVFEMDPFMSKYIESLIRKPASNDFKLSVSVWKEQEDGTYEKIEQPKLAEEISKKSR